MQNIVNTVSAAVVVNVNDVAVGILLNVNFAWIKNAKANNLAGVAAILANEGITVNEQRNQDFSEVLLGCHIRCRLGHPYWLGLERKALPIPADINVHRQRRNGICIQTHTSVNSAYFQRRFLINDRPCISALIEVSAGSE